MSDRPLSEHERMLAQMQALVDNCPTLERAGPVWMCRICGTTYAAAFVTEEDANRTHRERAHRDAIRQAFGPDLNIIVGEKPITEDPET